MRLLSRFLGSLRAHNLQDLLQSIMHRGLPETWIMHHASFLSEATLIEIGVYKNGRPKTDPCGTPNELTSFLESYGPSFIVWSFLFR